MHEDAKRKVDEDRCGGVANPLAPLTDSHLRVCVCLGVRHSDNICQGRLPAPPSLNTDGKVVFLVENGGSCLDFRHADRRLHSFTLSESSFSTSFLIRRSMKGFRIMCSLESWSETQSAMSKRSHVTWKDKWPQNISTAKFNTAYSTVVSRKTGRTPELSEGLTLVNGRLVFGVALNVLGEPLVKLFMGIKQRRHDEVQQGPQLGDGNNTTVSTLVVFTCSRRQLTSAMVF